ncbi:hypothetical protein AB3G45_24300 [Shinella sp. S4-D37]|jgi:hypothetical protein|uniref:hypothetical protein n=1 Tax=Shinella sp. S4-D37 TaxID=3161999 RepID=UPI0034668F53
MSKVIKLKEDNQEKVVTGPATGVSAAADHRAPEATDALRRATEKIVSLNRDSTHHAFELGACFAEVKALVPEKGFGRYLKTFTDYTVRSAWNYISIYERLGAYRDTLSQHAVLPTVMFELAKGEPAQIETVIARMDDGERIKVKDVREMLGTKPKPKSDTAILNVGGPAGLRKVAQWKLDQDAVKFGGLVSEVLKEVEKALEPSAVGRAVWKSPLQKKVVHDCRHAYDLINSIAAPLQPQMVKIDHWRPANLPDGTGWREVQKLLYRMGGVECWPGRVDFVPWLQNEVVPLLRFAIHGEPLPGEVEGAGDVDGEAKPEQSTRQAA